MNDFALNEVLSREYHHPTMPFVPLNLPETIYGPATPHDHLEHIVTGSNFNDTNRGDKPHYTM